MQKHIVVMGALAGSSAAIAAPFTVTGAGYRVPLTAPPEYPTLVLGDGSEISPNWLLQSGLFMGSGTAGTEQFFPGFTQTLRDSTVLGGIGGVRDWDTDSTSDTDVDGRPMTTIGGGITNTNGFGWALEFAWVGSSIHENQHNEFPSAPGVIGGVPANMYWLGQIVLPVGEDIEPHRLFPFPFSSQMEVLVNYAYGSGAQYANTVFRSDEFVRSEDGSWSATAMNQGESFWYTFLRDSDFESGEKYSLYISDAPLSSPPLNGEDIPTPATVSVAGCIIVMVRRRRQQKK